MEPRRKTLDDFPQFTVSQVNGRDVLGSFDTSEGVRGGRCWLLLPERTALIGDLSNLDPRSASGTFSSADDTTHVLPGQRLAYLSAYWQAYHVWMILDDRSQWERICFHAVDAVSESFEGNDGKLYRKLSKLKPGEELPAGAQVVSGGWDHEHCELCNKHIDPGDDAYRNRDRIWVCLGCFDTYVGQRNLAFVDEL